jgi:hypothetical protein
VDPAPHPEQTSAAPERKDKKKDKDRDGVGLTVKVLGLLTALLTCATAALGLFAKQTSNDLDDATDQRDELSVKLDTAQEQVVQLEQDLADATSTTTTTADDESTPGGSGPVGADAFLADLVPVVDRSWDNDRDLNVDGTVYAHGIKSGHLGYCGTNGPGTEREVEYSINREYRSLDAVAGLSEESAPDLPVKLEIFGDGRSLWSQTLVVGQPQAVDIDVTGVLRLRIVTTKEFDNPGGCNYVYAALGDPKLDG